MILRHIFHPKDLFELTFTYAAHYPMASQLAFDPQAAPAS